MIDEVKACVDAKVNFFEEYFTVSEGVQAELDDFIRETSALGESCTNAAEFETRYASEGLAGRFSALVPKCVPKARAMTREEKRQSVWIAKDILLDEKENIVKDAVSEAVNDAVIKARSDRAKESRERMIEDGTFAEHTIRSNRLEAVGSIARFLKDKFKK